jgi:nicotinate phosphoribosyltransferase
MPWVDDGNVALYTDLYELTMAAGYHAEALDQDVTFDLFVRRLPERRGFLVACGIEDALEYLEGLRFSPAALDYLRTLDLFDESFLDRLGALTFSGEVWAVPEGEVVFGNEPILRVTGPLIEAQIVETFLINAVVFQTMVASKAARVAIACGDRRFVDFAARRVHGVDAGLKAARASYVGGAAATSLVVAGQVYGLPVSGTMAHSYVMAHEREIDAFRAYVRQFPQHAILLIDTYDTVEGARRAAQVAHELEAEGCRLQAVRLDSGDIPALAREVRAILDEAGLEEVELIASGDLDEYKILEMVAAGTPIDSFGVGTQMGTSADAPSLGGVYKLVEDERGPKIKLAEEKVTLPGRKQVWRFDDHDVVGLAGEDGDEVAGGRPLLEPVMRAGRRLRPAPPLAEARERRAAAVAALPRGVCVLAGRPAAYPVRRTAALDALVERARAAVGG